MVENLIIIGSGPAGYTAALYAARAQLNPILLTGDSPGGQLMITTDVENYPGFAEIIQGPWLMEQMKLQCKKVGVNIVSETVNSCNFSKGPFEVVTREKTYLAKSVIISTGAQAKWLGLPSEEKYRGFGVSGCATCDGCFFKNQEVVVIGGGNTAVEEALYLTHHASKVILIHRRDSLRAEKVLQDRLFKNKKIEVKWNRIVSEIVGNGKEVTGIKLNHTIEDCEETIDCTGVFVAIGHSPSTEIFKGLVDFDKDGYISVKPGTTRTSVEGVFAAGDVQDKIYRQAVTAAGQGCMAALDAEKYISSLS
jgi:thioredoxin reductase (NADPH)